MDKQIDFDYLDCTQVSGVANLYGTAPYLQTEFPELCDGKEQTREIVKTWISRSGMSAVQWAERSFTLKNRRNVS